MLFVWLLIVTTVKCRMNLVIKLEAFYAQKTIDRPINRLFLLSTFSVSNLFMPIGYFFLFFCVNTLLSMFRRSWLGIRKFISCSSNPNSAEHEFLIVVF